MQDPTSVFVEFNVRNVGINTHGAAASLTNLSGLLLSVCGGQALSCSAMHGGAHLGALVTP